jgi:hypothetical protein
MKQHSRVQLNQVCSFVHPEHANEVYKLIHHSCDIRFSERALVDIFMFCYLYIYFQAREKARPFQRTLKEEKSILIVPTHPIRTTGVVNTVRERVIGR